MAEERDISAAIQAGRQLVDLTTRVHLVDGVPVMLVDHLQRIEVPEAAIRIAETMAPAPRRRKGTAQHRELSSFVAHVKRFAGPNSAIWADIESAKLVAVFDYHPAGAAEPASPGAAWCQHRAVYVGPKAPAWVQWTAASESWMAQDGFADFIEDNLDDLASGPKDGSYPAPMTILEMARKLELHTKGRFSRKIDPRSGDYSIVCQQETESSSTEVPRAFLVALPVFVGGELYRIEARVRCRIQDGVPQLSFVLHRAAEVERDAFADVRKQAAEGTGLPVFAGTPEG